MPETLKQAVKAIFGISLAAFSIGFVFGLAFPLKADAAVIVQQTQATTTGDASFANVYFQQIGTGFSGVPTAITFLLNSTGVGDVRASGAIRCYTDSTYSTGCPGVGNGSGNLQYYSSTSTIAATQAEYRFRISSSTYELDSSKYYAIGIRVDRDISAQIQVGGVGTNVYANGSCWTGSSYCTGLGDAYFKLETSNGSVSEGITGIIAPTYASVVPSANNVNFSFTYNNLSLYTSSGFDLVDNTTGQSIYTASASSTISSSGSGTFSGYLDIVSGHTYTWTPWIKGTGLTPLYGTPTFFFAVTSSSVYIPPASSNPYATTSFGSIYNGLISTSTTGRHTVYYQYKSAGYNSCSSSCHTTTNRRGRIPKAFKTWDISYPVHEHGTELTTHIRELKRRRLLWRTPSSSKYYTQSIA